MAMGNQDFSFRVFDYAYGDLEGIHVAKKRLAI